MRRRRYTPCVPLALSISGLQVEVDYDPDEDVLFATWNNGTVWIHGRGRSLDELRESFRASKDALETVLCPHCGESFALREVQLAAAERVEKQRHEALTRRLKSSRDKDP